MGQTKATKKRNWAFVIYPTEGDPPAPEDWLEQLKQSGLQCAISPLHDKDTDPDEQCKRAHRHVIAVYGSPTTYNNVKRLTDSLNAPVPIPLEQVKGYYRYLTHKDNPEKYQYDDKDIITINGFNIADYTDLTRSENNEYKRAIQRLCREKNITEYAVLLDYLMDTDMWTEWEIATTQTILFTGYLRSRRHCNYAHMQVDPETGEVIDS